MATACVEETLFLSGQIPHRGGAGWRSSRCRQGFTGTSRQLHWYERSAHLVRCSNRLSITFVVPILHCSVCDDVQTVSDGRGNTFLEVDGRFLQMSGIPSHACGREQFLPKPTFSPGYDVGGAHNRRQAFLECAVLVDHLFCLKGKRPLLAFSFCLIG